jgi:hypothetical protein
LLLGRPRRPGRDKLRPTANLKVEFHNFLSTHPPAQFSSDFRRLVNDLLDLLELAEKEFTKMETIIKPLQ